MSRRATQLFHSTATSTASTENVLLKSVIVSETGGLASGQAVIRDGSTGANLIVMRVPANNTATWTSGDETGVLFTSSLHVVLSGSTATFATVEFQTH